MKKASSPQHTPQPLTPPAGSRLHDTLLGHVNAAIDALDSGAPTTDVSIHTARKEIKRARSVLRLLRGRIGETRYQRENRTLRDAAKLLTPARDAKVMLDTLRDVLKRSGRRSPATFTRARALVESGNGGQARTPTGERTVALQRSRRMLRTMATRIERWQIPGETWPDIGPAFARIYKRGRAAFKTAANAPNTENLHEWRKHVKYLWHALQLIETAMPEAAHSRTVRAHRLSDLLGEDHDLAVLAERLSESPATHGTLLADDLLPSIESHRTKLRQKALALGGSLFKERPRVIEAKVGKQWVG